MWFIKYEPRNDHQTTSSLITLRDSIKAFFGSEAPIPYAMDHKLWAI